MSTRIVKSVRSGFLFGTVIVSMNLSLAGCSFMTSAGPTVGMVNQSDGKTVANADIKIVELTGAVAEQVIAAGRKPSFEEEFGEASPVGTTIDKGDVLDIAIWEAPPAVLFGSSIGGLSDAIVAGNQVARNTALPEQMVDSDGRIAVPFVGTVQAAGRTPQDISREIVSRLRNVAHLPQVIVRLVRNSTKNVTVVGDVVSSARVPLTAKGERLLDALAAAGGAKQPVSKTMIQITRGTQVASQPLDVIVTDPRQNIRLQADDVITAYFQPFSFTALGATGVNAEIPFEGTGITLAQALGRVGGLNDQRANAKGIFIFRLEEPAVLGAEVSAGAHMTPDQKVPVIYRIDLKDPATFFVAQSFPIRNKDVLYVSNAPMADLQKFVNIVSSVVIPVITLQNATKN